MVLSFKFWVIYYTSMADYFQWLYKWKQRFIPANGYLLYYDKRKIYMFLHSIFVVFV